jgi:hypothetical protein
MKSMIARLLPYWCAGLMMVNATGCMPTFSVGGNVSGLKGELVLALNGTVSFHYDPFAR